MIKREYMKWFGYFSVVVVMGLDVAPSTFHVSPVLRPWVFVGSIVWIFCIISGVFIK